MGDEILHVTWSIRTASNCCATPLQTSNLKNHEKDLTSFVDRSYATTRSKKKDETEDLHVDLSWFKSFDPTTYHNNEEGDDEVSLALTHASASISPTATTTFDRHLHIRVMQEHQVQHNAAPKAQMILCYCQGTPDVVNGFAFVMVRGTNMMLQSLFRWLESRAGVIVSHRPFNFSPSQVAHCLASWTTTATSMNQQEHGMNPEDDTVVASTTTKTTTTTTSSIKKGGPRPLELTFAVPQVVASKGLDMISLTIPPVSLMRLCCDIESQRPRARADNDASLDDHADTFEETIPILKALQCYILQVFHIDIRSFPLVRASSSTAMLSCDGRCKLQDDRFLSHVLHDIRILVQQRFGNANVLPDEEVEEDND